MADLWEAEGDAGREEVRFLLAGNGGAAGLARLLSASDDAAAQRQACWALRNLASGGDDQREAVASAPGCAAGLAALLSAGGAGVAAQAARALAELSDGDRATTGERLLPCLAALVTGLSHSDAGVAAQAARALALLSRSGTHSDLITGIGGCVAGLVSLLGRDDADAMAQAAYALANLASAGGEGAAQRIADEGGSIPACVALLGHATAVVAKKAAFLLGRLCKAEGAAERVAEGVPGLVALLRHDSTGVVEEAAEALSALVDVAALAERIGSESTAIASAVRLLGHGSDPAAEYAARLLGGLVDESSKGAQVAAADGILPAAVGGLSRPASVAKAMAALLEQLASISRDVSKRVAAEPGLFAALVSLAGGADAGAATEAVAVLSQLACDARNLLMAASGSLAALVAALGRPDDAKLAVWAMEDLADGDVGRAERVACEPGCVAAVVACLDSADAGVLEHATAALANLAHSSTENIAVRISAAPGALRGLFAALSRSEEAVVSNAAFALWDLAVGGDDDGVARYLTANAGCISGLAALAGHSSVLVASAVAGALANLSQYAAFASCCVESAPALLPGLVKLAASPEDDTATNAIVALHRLCAHGAAGRVGATPGLYTALAAALGRTNAEPAACAACVLSDLAADSSGAKQRIVDGGCLAPLVALHASANAAAAKDAGRALAALAKKGDFCAARLAMEPGCIAGCVARMPNVDAEIAQDALRALAGMAAGGGERVAAADPAVFNRLVVASRHADPRVAGAAAAALGALAEFSAALRKRAAATPGVISALTALLCRCSAGGDAAAVEGSTKAAAAAMAALKSLDGGAASRKRQRT